MTTTQSATQEATPKTIARTGGCHCGAVRYEVALAPDVGGSQCNCTICTKIGAVATIAKPAALKVVAGEAELTEYRWGGEISRRFFCRRCGIHCFARGHLAELGGDYVSVNLLTIDEMDPATLTVVHWDGRHDNWYAGARSTPWPVMAG